MTVFVALLRAVNVGGTGPLPMATLRALCEDAGFTNVRTYIASGNVVFAAGQRASEVKALLEARLLAHAGKKVDVIVRSAQEMADVLAANPFADRPGNQTFAMFFDEAPAADTITTATGRSDEELALGKREVYAYYPGGMGRSKLKLPRAKEATARNMNTIVSLVAMSAAGE